MPTQINSAGSTIINMPPSMAWTGPGMTLIVDPSLARVGMAGRSLM
jgi:hypothetical protein